MDLGRVVLGGILAVVAVWAFVTQTDFTAKYAGGAILGILALAVLYSGVREKR